MQTFQEVLDAARTLSSADRVHLCQTLWGEVPLSEWPKPSPEWIAEAQRRSAAIDRGEMKSSPWPEVRERVRREAGL